MTNPVSFPFFVCLFVCRLFHSSLTLCHISSFLIWSVQLIFILLQHHISKLSRCFWTTFMFLSELYLYVSVSLTRYLGTCLSWLLTSYWQYDVLYFTLWSATLTTYELCCCPELTRCTNSGVNSPHVYTPTVWSTFVQCFRCGPAVYDVHIISFRSCGALFQWMIVTVLTVVWALFSDTLQCYVPYWQLTSSYNWASLNYVCFFCFRHQWQQSRGFEYQI